MICLPCNQRLDESYDFKCRIENSDEKLRQILKLKSSPSDSVTSASIVTAIIADVISSVISTEKESTEKQDICSTNFCPDNFCFAKDDTPYCLNSDKNFFSYDKEPQSQLNSTQQKICLENVNVYKSLLGNDHARPIKEEALSLLDDHVVQNSDTSLKVEGNDASGHQQLLDETSKTDSIQNTIQDDEEKPLISRTARLRCAQCIKSFQTKVALQRDANNVHKRKTKLRYVCYICDKQYSTLAKVKNHIAMCYESHSRKEGVRDKRINHERRKRMASVQDKRINNIQVSHKLVYDTYDIKNLVYP